MHVVCLHYSPELIDLILKCESSWLCWECKTCAKCGMPSYYSWSGDSDTATPTSSKSPSNRASSQQSSNNYVCCSSCDLLYHTKCTSIPLSGRDSKKRFINWCCAKCTERFGKGLSLTMPYLKDQWRMCAENEASPTTKNKLMNDLLVSSRKSAK